MEHKGFDEMNVIPLVDIMLVLLTIVLTTATFIVSGEIAVNLPEAKHRDASSANPIVITLTKDDKLFVDKKELTWQEFANYLNAFKSEQPVVIRADEDVPIKKFAYVADTLKGNRFKKVSMEVNGK